MSSLGTRQRASHAGNVTTKPVCTTSKALLPLVTELLIPADCVAKNPADVIYHGRVGQRPHVGDGFSLLIDRIYAKDEYRRLPYAV